MSLDHTAGFVKRLAPTRDAFLGSKLTVFQPSRGFRAGIDSVLLGASVAPGSENLADLGAGVGVAALVALIHNKQLHALLVEADGDAVALAQQNLQCNALADRGRTSQLDVTDAGAARARGGLKANEFTTVIANPPYFDAAAGTLATNDKRATGRHMDAAKLDMWVRAAASCAAPGGEAIFIYPASGLKALLPAFEGRFGAMTILPIAPRAGEDATRILLRGIKGSRAPMSLKSPLVTHDRQGRAFLPPIEAIFRGEEALHW